jgi:hypothetical protein
VDACVRFIRYIRMLFVFYSTLTAQSTHRHSPNYIHSPNQLEEVYDEGTAAIENVQLMEYQWHMPFIGALRRKYNLKVGNITMYAFLKICKNRIGQEPVTYALPVIEPPKPTLMSTAHW